jgi:hypothetical protein
MKQKNTVLSPNTPIPIFKAPPPLSIPMDNNRINQPSIMRTVAEGFAFGTGSSIAREAVGGVLASSKKEEKTFCDKYIELYEHCLSNNDIDCQLVFSNMINACK